MLGAVEQAVGVKRQRPLGEVVVRIAVGQAIDVDQDQPFNPIADVGVAIRLVQVLVATAIRVVLLAVRGDPRPIHAD